MTPQVKTAGKDSVKMMKKSLTFTDICCIIIMNDNYNYRLLFADPRGIRTANGCAGQF